MTLRTLLDTCKDLKVEPARGWVEDGENVDTWTMEELKEVVKNYEKIREGKVGKELLEGQFLGESSRPEQDQDQDKEKAPEEDGKAGEETKLVGMVPGMVPATFSGIGEAGREGQSAAQGAA